MLVPLETHVRCCWIYLAIEVSKRQAKVRETPGNSENSMKLEAVETKLQDLKTNMAILGKEVAAAMVVVEAQQQRLTLHHLIAMVEAKRAYHQRVLQILDQLEEEVLFPYHGESEVELNLSVELTQTHNESQSNP
ncbi:hypothetical protein JHK85_001000 [Glycine max]|nr:hypothetical protein JHK85_001000 [Glycine max]